MTPDFERTMEARRLIVLAKGGIDIAGIDERILIPNIVERLRKRDDEIERLRGALQFYADEDVRSVEAGTLEGVSKRPATAALAGEIVPDTTNLEKAEELPAGLPECLFQHCPTLDKCKTDGCRQPRPKESSSDTPGPEVKTDA